MPDPVLSARHLRKVYRTGEVEVVALGDVSLDVAAGEFIVLLGASGSGKSTLLNILGGHAEHAWVTQGLAPGDTVLVYPPSAVADGVRVRIRKG